MILILGKEEKIKIYFSKATMIVVRKAGNCPRSKF